MFNSMKLAADQLRAGSPDSRQANGVSELLFGLCLTLGTVLAIAVDSAGWPEWATALMMAGFTLAGTYLLFALKIANQWEKAVVLRFGRFRGMAGPGLFWIVPYWAAVTPVRAHSANERAGLAPAQGSASLSYSPPP